MRLRFSARHAFNCSNISYSWGFILLVPRVECRRFLCAKPVFFSWPQLSPGHGLPPGLVCCTREALRPFANEVAADIKSYGSTKRKELANHGSHQLSRMRETGFNRSADLPWLRIPDRGKAGANPDRASRRSAFAGLAYASAGGDSPFLVGILLVRVLLLVDHPAHHRLFPPGLDGAENLSTAGHVGTWPSVQELPGY